MDNTWLVNGRLVTPDGIEPAALRIASGRIVERRRRAPAGAVKVDLRGRYLASGFIDLHVWGEPSVVARAVVRDGTTAFLTALAPEPRTQLSRSVAERSRVHPTGAAVCLGLHLEGPYLNPLRGGVLPKRAMRAPNLHELAALQRASGGRIKLITLAPELPGARAAIRWCRAHKITVSLGHTDADADAARAAVDAGARAVTHLWNSMRGFEHRRANLIETALTDARLTAMVIADGVHVNAAALQVAYRMKGARGLILATDSVRHQQQAWKLRQVGGAYRSRDGVLAGSALTMIGAVRNMVRRVGAPLHEAVTMATHNPAALLGLSRTYGTLAIGARADLVSFDDAFRVHWTMVGGREVFAR